MSANNAPCPETGVAWNPSLACGHAQIDAEHQTLVGMIDRVARSRAPDGPPPAGLIAELRQYAQNHFRTEGELMQRWPVDPVRRQAHLRAHGGFVHCLQRAEALAASHPAEVTQTLLGFLVDWLVHHIQGMDRALVDEIHALETGADAAAKAAASPALPLVDAISDLYERMGARGFDLIEANRALQQEIERRARAEQALRVSEARFSSLVRNAPVVLLELDWTEVAAELAGPPGPQGGPERARAGPLEPAQAAALAGKLRLLAANDAALRLFGCTSLAGLVERVSSSLGAQALPTFARVALALVDGRTDHSAEVEVRREDGQHRQLAFNVFDTPHEQADAAPSRRLILAAVDVTERNLALARMQHLALHDPLTDLPNRTLLQERARQVLAECRRERRHSALINLDLDRFKPVNDEFGHDTGDLLLQAVARRLRAALREADTVARVGGDEFLVLLHQVDDRAAAARVAQHLQQQLAQPFELAGPALSIGASAGVALYPDDGDTLHALTLSADRAMYEVKRGRQASA